MNRHIEDARVAVHSLVRAKPDLKFLFNGIGVNGLNWVLNFCIANMDDAKFFPKKWEGFDVCCTLHYKAQT